MGITVKEYCESEQFSMTLITANSLSFALSATIVMLLHLYIGGENGSTEKCPRIVL